LSAIERISAIVVGEAEMACIMYCRPPSMRLAISISPSRVSSSTVPISRMYMRTGSVVRPNSESTVDSAASAASSASSRRGGARAAGDQQRGGVGRLLVHRDAHVVEHRDDGLEDLVVDQLLGQVVVDLLVRQETTRLAHLDERLELLAALGDFLLGERGLVQAELAHQRALLGARHLHAQRLGLGGLGFALVGGLDFRLAFQVGLESSEKSSSSASGLPSPSRRACPACDRACPWLHRRPASRRLRCGEAFAATVFFLSSSSAFAPLRVRSWRPAWLQALTGALFFAVMQFLGLWMDHGVRRADTCGALPFVACKRYGQLQAGGPGSAGKLT
jgi:hypothetical protein